MLQKKSIFLLIFLLFFTATATAELEFYDTETHIGVLDKVFDEFKTKASTWESIITNAAAWIFWTLGTISLAWTMGILALKKSDISDFFSEFIRFILFFGFFYWLLRNGPEIAKSIIFSLHTLGKTTSGKPGLSPSSMVNIGFIIWRHAVDNITVWTPVDTFIGMTLSAAILILLTVIATNMILLFISAWILMYAGIFFLGFGGSRWTSDMALNYFKTVFGIAIQIFTMILIAGIGLDLLTTFYVKMSNGTPNFEELGVMLVFCVALLLLVSKIPQLLASIITGGGIGSASGIGNFTASDIAAAVTSARSTASAAMSVGATFFGGSTQSLMAAFSKAANTESTGGMQDFLKQTNDINSKKNNDSIASAMGDIVEKSGFTNTSSSNDKTGFNDDNKANSMRESNQEKQEFSKNNISENLQENNNTKKINPPGASKENSLFLKNNKKESTNKNHSTKNSSGIDITKEIAAFRDRHQYPFSESED
ncbi:MAG: P-type conjugative transfer protein TrbL [Pseudomonadota bacterium]